MAKRIYKKRRRIRKPGACYYCKQKAVPEYRETDALRHFISDRGKIIPRLDSGVCHKHQRLLSAAVKRARFLALLPYIERPY